MAEKKFFLQSSAELQRIGLRAQIVSFLIAHGIREGNALNDLENKKKVIIAIRAEEEKAIEQVKTELVRYLNKLKYEDEECYGQFPTDITASELTDLNNPHSIKILSLTDLANSLMLEQTSKGVGAMLSLTNVLKPLASLPEAIRGLSERIGGK